MKPINFLLICLISIVSTTSMCSAEDVAFVRLEEAVAKELLKVELSREPVVFNLVSEEEISKVATKIEKYLEKISEVEKSSPRFGRDATNVLRRFPQDYILQVAGFKREGHPHLFFYGISRTIIGSDSPQQVFMMLDGGSNCWRVTYDMESGKFMKFRSNGEA